MTENNNAGAKIWKNSVRILPLIIYKAVFGTFAVSKFIPVR